MRNPEIRRRLQIIFFPFFLSKKHVSISKEVCWNPPSGGCASTPCGRFEADQLQVLLNSVPGRRPSRVTNSRHGQSGIICPIVVRQPKTHAPCLYPPSGPLIPLTVRQKHCSSFLTLDRKKDSPALFCFLRPRDPTGLSSP